MRKLTCGEWKSAWETGAVLVSGISLLMSMAMLLIGNLAGDIAGNLEDIAINVNVNGNIGAWGNVV